MDDKDKENYFFLVSTCKNCRRSIVRITDEPKEIWRHLEPHPTKKGMMIVGKTPCRRTNAEPDNG